MRGKIWGVAKVTIYLNPTNQVHQINGEVVDCSDPPCCEDKCIDFSSSGTWVAPCDADLEFYFNDDAHTDNAETWTFTFNAVDYTITASSAGAVTGPSVTCGTSYSYSITGGSKSDLGNDATGIYVVRYANSPVRYVGPDGTAYDSSGTKTDDPRASIAGFICPSTGFRYTVVGKMVNV